MKIEGESKLCFGVPPKSKLIKLYLSCKLINIACLLDIKEDLVVDNLLGRLISPLTFRTCISWLAPLRDLVNKAFLFKYSQNFLLYSRFLGGRSEGSTCSVVWYTFLWAWYADIQCYQLLSMEGNGKTPHPLSLFCSGSLFNII